jgi:hypothetical protein
MKTTPGIGVLVFVLVVMGGMTSRASADFFPGQTLGGTILQTDVWALTCGLGTVRAVASVTDSAGIDGRRINVCVTNVDGAPGQCRSTDAGFSGEAVATGGPGHYIVTINETGAASAAEAYSLFIACRNSTGGITPHSHFQMQNQ